MGETKQTKASKLIYFIGVIHRTTCRKNYGVSYGNLVLHEMYYYSELMISVFLLRYQFQNRGLFHHTFQYKFQITIAVGQICKTNYFKNFNSQ